MYRLLLLFSIIVSTNLAADEVDEVVEALDTSSPDTQTLIIGTMHSPPFCIRNPDGTWSGISIELWRQVANDLNLTYQLEEYNLKSLLDGVQNGTLDVAVAALTVTEQRELLMDFTHPLHSTGFAIATRPAGQKNIWLSTFQQLFSFQFLQVVGVLLLLLFVVGWLMWLVEHKHEPKEEDSHTIRHIGEGFWWAAATMTTVGYGDKTPLTRIGRAFGVIWMFTALVIVASFIAAFSSILTVQKIGANLQGLNDLSQLRVATVPGSTSETYLKRNGIATRTYANVSEGLNGVAEGEVDAMVYDAPLIRYFAQTQFEGRVEVLPVTFERQDYGFALPENSELREPINRILLRIVRGEDWSETLERYLGG
ncbi:MAG: polar amino acid transport system substrate-binding protein [Flavobacterium sp.]|jgi:polar amino acid transport system substrate-binding protein